MIVLTRVSGVVVELKTVTTVLSQSGVVELHGGIGGQGDGTPSGTANFHLGAREFRSAFKNDSVRSSIFEFRLAKLRLGVVIEN